MVLIAPEIQRVVDATHKSISWVVLIDGVVTECRDATVRYGVDSPIGSCSLTLNLPLPPQAVPNAGVEVQAGYTGEMMHTIFTGTIPTRTRSLSRSGGMASLRAVSLGNRLAGRDYTDVEYSGPMSLRALFQAMCNRRKLANYYSDATTYPDGVTTIRLGNVKDANNNKIIVPKRTTSLAFLNDIAQLFGYYVFDTPNGMRQQRVSGIPSGDHAIAVTEAWNAMQINNDDTLDGLVNFWEVFGARYTDADGATVAIRSIPLNVPPDYRLGPTGYAREERSSDLLDTVGLADAVRNVQEINHSAPYQLVTWTTHGAPHLMPGSVANVTSPNLDVSGLQWVMNVEHTLDREGFHTRCEGWHGAGSALAAGQDCIVTAIPGGPWHVGDEYLWWYAVPRANGLTITVPFTVTEGFSSIVMRGLAHGTNSYLLNGANTESEVSRFEIWQNGKKVGDGKLPVLNENYANRYPYGKSDAYWSRFVVPISGTLEPAAAELRIISGKDTRASGGPQDDFEVKNLAMTTCGIGMPVLPVERSA